jgi:hypothetical protein
VRISDRKKEDESLLCQLVYSLVTVAPDIGAVLEELHFYSSHSLSTVISLCVKPQPINHCVYIVFMN